jgi:hypothetical protein
MLQALCADAEDILHAQRGLVLNGQLEVGLSAIVLSSMLSTQIVARR